jgi:hypothetical protein
VHIINVDLPQQEDVKYLVLHLDRRPTWRKHMFTKRKQPGTTLTKMHLLHGWKSKLSTSNKIVIHKVKLKHIWTYGIQLWGTASTSNIEILELFQSKVLRMIVDETGQESCHPNDGGAKFLRNVGSYKNHTA